MYTARIETPINLKRHTTTIRWQSGGNLKRHQDNLAAKTPPQFGGKDTTTIRRRRRIAVDDTTSIRRRRRIAVVSFFPPPNCGGLFPESFRIVVVSSRIDGGFEDYDPLSY